MEQQLRPYSLRQRLLFWLLLSLFMIGLAGLYDTYVSARATADEISDRVLAGSTLAIAERIFVNDDGRLEVDIPYVALEMLTSAEGDRVYYKIENINGDFITGYRLLEIPASKPLIAQRLIDGEVGFVDGTFRDIPIRVAVLNGAASSSTLSLGYRLAVAETTNSRSKMASDILVRTALRQALLILTAAIAVWFAVSRALQPLYKVQAAIGRRNSDDLRPILHQVPSEISGLVSTINDLLERIGKNIRALRNFTSNASHQLRTPLTVMRTQIAISQRAKTKGAVNAAIRKADEAVVDAEKVVAKLLVLARIDSVAQQDMSKHTCDIAEICRTVCFDIIAANGNSNIDLGYEGPEKSMVRGEPVLCREMIKNLVDNGIKYGGSKGQVTIACRPKKDICVIEITDEGPGIDEAQMAILSKRFNRGDEDSDGIGLGLAISGEIAELFGGRIEMQNRQGAGGLKVTIILHSEQA